MSILRLYDENGELIAKAFINQESLMFYVKRGKEESYKKRQAPQLANCPVEVLDVLPGEPYPKPRRVAVP